MFYSINDLLDIVKNGIPFVDEDLISIQSSNGPDIGSSYVFITGFIRLPFDKIKDVSIESSNPSYAIMNMIHPAIRHSSNGCSVTLGFTSKIEKSMFGTDFVISLQLDQVSRLVREIRETQFYSALEKALDSPET